MLCTHLLQVIEEALGISTLLAYVPRIPLDEMNYKGIYLMIALSMSRWNLKCVGGDWNCTAWFCANSGVFLPKDWDILVNVAAIHLNPDNYLETHKCHPPRLRLVFNTELVPELSVGKHLPLPEFLTCDTVRLRVEVNQCTVKLNFFQMCMFFDLNRGSVIALPAGFSWTKYFHNIWNWKSNMRGPRVSESRALRVSFIILSMHTGTVAASNVIQSLVSVKNETILFGTHFIHFCMIEVWCYIICDPSRLQS